ncbi:MAG: T9SS type A sorting domain-containing protein [FCB group bacterium]|jgi:hypothetical protein
MKTKLIYFTIVFVVGILLNIPMQAQTTKLQSPTVSSGYTKMSSNNFHLDVIAGQVAAGNSKGSQVNGDIGFLHRTFSITTVPDINQNGGTNSISIINYPNPFYEDTRFRFELKGNDNVLLTIFDESGKDIETLVNGEMIAGTYDIQFHAKELASGVYIYKFKTSTKEESGKIVLVK